jgi:hypothetical protein
MFPMNYTIPALEMGWGIFTLLQYRAQGYAELMAYRFFVGIFEVRTIAKYGPAYVFVTFLLRTSSRLHSFRECIMSWVHGTEATS